MMVPGWFFPSIHVHWSYICFHSGKTFGRERHGESFLILSFLPYRICIDILFAFSSPLFCLSESARVYLSENEIWGSLSLHVTAGFINSMRILPIQIWQKFGICSKVWIIGFTREKVLKPKGNRQALNFRCSEF
jgi:hypothetical protein